MKGKLKINKISAGDIKYLKSFALILCLLLMVNLFSSASTNAHHMQFQSQVSNKNFIQTHDMKDVEEQITRLLDVANNSFDICGPAYVTSSGKGLHAGRNFHVIQYQGPGTLPLILSPNIINYWLIVCNYGFDENATTTIVPLKSNSSPIEISGRHWVICGVLKFPIDSYTILHLIRNFIEKLVGKDLVFPISDIITLLDGKVFWNWSGIYYLLSLGHFFLNPLKIKIPLYGFVKSLDIYGYSLFTIYGSYE